MTLPGAVAALVRGWVGLYTLGLAPAAREERRVEIDCDLWEHRHHAAATGESPSATSLVIIGRWAAGIPADLSWRASHRRNKTTKEKTMTIPAGRLWWQALAVLTAALTVYGGLRQFFSSEVTAALTAGKVAGLGFAVAAGLLITVGLVLHPTKPRPGAALVIVGVLPAAVLGGLGLGIVFGLIASLAGGEGWWWAPAAIAGAAATAAGLGAFAAWWNATPRAPTTSLRVNLLPTTLVLAGVLAATGGVGLGGPPLWWGLGSALAVTGLILWRRRLAAR